MGQIIGVLFGSAVAVPALLLIFNTYQLGTPEMTAPTRNLRDSHGDHN